MTTVVGGDQKSNHVSSVERTWRGKLHGMRGCWTTSFGYIADPSDRLADGIESTGVGCCFGNGILPARGVGSHLARFLGSVVAVVVVSAPEVCSQAGNFKVVKRRMRLYQRPNMVHMMPMMIT